MQVVFVCVRHTPRRRVPGAGECRCPVCVPSNWWQKALGRDVPFCLRVDASNQHDTQHNTRRRAHVTKAAAIKEA
jgi:hypothetical protein